MGIARGNSNINTAKGYLHRSRHKDHLRLQQCGAGESNYDYISISLCCGLSFIGFLTLHILLLQAMIMPQLQGSVYQVEVRNCRDLIVDSNTVDQTEGLRKITFQHIDQLTLYKNALSVSRYKALIVEFEQVNFRQIDSHAISGNIEEISFVGGRIEQMQPFGFTTTKDSAILLKLDGVTVQRMESQVRGVKGEKETGKEG